VFKSQPNAREVSRQVTELPPEFEVRRVGDHWAIVGPTGIFVVGRATRDVARSCERTSAVAHALRSALSNDVSWVPFVDALVVADQERPGLACTVIELDMLLFALTWGGTTIDPVGLAQIQHHMPVAIRSLQAAKQRPLPA
jgi:hypothetical protein